MINDDIFCNGNNDLTKKLAKKRSTFLLRPYGPRILLVVKPSENRLIKIRISLTENAVALLIDYNRVTTFVLIAAI